MAMKLKGTQPVTIGIAENRPNACSHRFRFRLSRECCESGGTLPLLLRFTTPSGMKQHVVQCAYGLDTCLPLTIRIHDCLWVRRGFMTAVVTVLWSRAV